MATYNFKKDGSSDDGKELSRYLNENATANTIAALAAGSYRVATGDHVGPGSLGVLPANVKYRLEPAGGYTLIVT